MRHPKEPEYINDGTSGHLGRRDFIALTVAAGVGVSASSVLGAQLSVVETNVDVTTPDGLCDAAFFHPLKGSHPGVLVWPDSQGLRSALRELGRRLAAEGFSVLVPNHLYRMAKAPVYDESFDIENPDDRERYFRNLEPFLAPGAAERDAVAHVAFLDTQPQVDRKKKIGTHGYCLGGAYVIRTAARLPDRVGAAASFHGGYLVTDKPDSPHLLAPKVKAPLYFAIASDDDQREPEVKTRLKEAFASARVRAEIEVYPNARHGWCVPDNKPPGDREDVERAWTRLIALYKSAL
jgi:carboxymethylenebutenolidase